MAAGRVLVVDDSVVLGRLLAAFVESDPRLALAGWVTSGATALERLEALAPDVVLMDVMMPGLDGIEAVTRLRALRPRLPVLMCSALTATGAETTLRALAAGATDCIAKPASGVGDGPALADFRTQLLEKLVALTESARSGRTPVVLPRPAPSRPRTASVEPEVVLVGCSTGGPNALAQLFAALREPLPVPLLLVQHMPPLFTAMLAERITQTTGYPAREGTDGEEVQAGVAYVAPGGSHLAVRRLGDRVLLEVNQAPPENSCRPAVDVLFRTAARIWGPGCLAVVLTGMGRDGTAGARAVVEAGGTVLVQDAATSVIPSMPTSVAEAGLASEVLPLDAVAPALRARCARRRAG